MNFPNVIARMARVVLCQKSVVPDAANANFKMMLSCHIYFIIMQWLVSSTFSTGCIYITIFKLIL